MTYAQMSYWQLQETRRHNQQDESARKYAADVSMYNAQLAANASKYATDTNAATSRYVADQNAMTQKYVAALNANVSSYNAYMNATTQRENARLQAETTRLTNQKSLATQVSIADKNRDWEKRQYYDVGLYQQQANLALTEERAMATSRQNSLFDDTYEYQIDNAYWNAVNSQVQAYSTVTHAVTDMFNSAVNFAKPFVFSSATAQKGSYNGKQEQKQTGSYEDYFATGPRDSYQQWRAYGDPRTAGDR